MIKSCIFKVEIKKRSRVPGVMITQYVEELPRGKTTPDFTRKPIALTVQEGRVAIFKAVVNGDPAPTVTWARNKGDTSDPEKYKPRYDERTREHVLEIVNVQVDQADTYKCFATNLFGKAMCTAALSVFADDQTNDPEDFRKMLRKTTIAKKRKEKPKKEGEIDPKFWEVMLSAKKSDYERICHEFGVTDYRWMLKQLNLKKKEKEDEQAKVVENVGNMKQIEVKTSGRAEFEFDMKLKDADSKINLYKNGEMLDYGDGTDDSSKHNMKKTGDKYKFSINNLGLNDGGLYQVDVEDVNIISTTLAIPDVEFDGILKDAKVVEGQDAMFEGIFSGPVPQITWCANDISVEHGDRYNITVSEDKLTHSLVVKNCKKEDKGVYTAIAGIKSSRATLAVDDNKPEKNMSKKQRVTHKPPSILVPLKRHTPPKGYQCYMTCAVRGCPSPYIAWYHNEICINSDNKYYITNTSGVCSMYILRVRPEDSGEYKVVAVNPFGKAECSSTLKVKGMTAAVFISMFEKCLPQSPDLHDGLSFVNSHVANNFQHGYVMQMGNSYARALKK
uniref:Immunoglobulin like and fibronectin type III domain containing 1, tandem duplicate 4 n=1 Tax=Sinocyclocheilus rhinocerous TaxID=307959 RepID=A0A673GY12_9TELE